MLILKKETRVMIRKKAMKQMEIALENQYSIPLSDNIFVNGLGEVAMKTVMKEGTEYVLYRMDMASPGEYKRNKITKKDALKSLDNYLSTFSKQRLAEELDYWKECVDFLEEENNDTFLNSYLSNLLER